MTALIEDLSPLPAFMHDTSKLARARDPTSDLRHMIW